MPDSKYCYPNSDVLKNKLNITDARKLFIAESKFTTLRLKDLQKHPIEGNFDYKHLKAIHEYIFQDIYEWAGEERTVEIGKGNIFCLTRCIPEYANSVFSKYFQQCYAAKNDFGLFIKVFSENYGDLNALHPFREGNGRVQREFARELCLKCGYNFSLIGHTHEEMLSASILSFEKFDNSQFEDIFSKAVSPCKFDRVPQSDILDILTSDDLDISFYPKYKYDYYDSKSLTSSTYENIYKNRIANMNQQIYPELNNIEDKEDKEEEEEDIEL